jgi:murein DD-endopeptidase MepM/ murein hydrolase activator NlpD
MLHLKAQSVRLAVALLSSIGLILLSAPAYASPTYVYPLMGPRLTSDFGLRSHPIRKISRHHDGVDLAAPEGAQVRSIQSGLVVFADPHGGYGNLIVVQHSGGVTSHYGHCKTINVKTGQRVRAGQLLGTVGSTGRVTGPHLHFEIRRNGKVLDPEAILPGLAVVGEG